MDPLATRNSDIQAHVLVGPTAAGKSAVAQWIAERKGWVILSADSMLVYRGMDIGTAKPTRLEQQRVQYWGIDLVEPDQPFNVAMFREEALRCVQSLAPGQGLMVVGGTGLYLRALLQGLQAGPEPSGEARARWQRLLDEEGVEALQQALRQISAGQFEALQDKRNPRRLIRALEKAEAGMAATEAHWSKDRMPTVVGLSLPKEVLQERIRSRVTGMYQQGLLDEVEGLRRRYATLSATAMQAIGYHEAGRCVDGELSREEAMEATIVRTRQLAKRQMTWFRGQMSVEWVEVERDTPVETVGEQVLRRWEAIGATRLELAR